MTLLSKVGKFLDSATNSTIIIYIIKRITSKDCIPFHIELPKSIIGNKRKYLIFSEILADTIKSLFAI